MTPSRRFVWQTSQGEDIQTRPRSSRETLTDNNQSELCLLALEELLTFQSRNYNDICGTRCPKANLKSTTPAPRPARPPSLELPSPTDAQNPRPNNLGFPIQFFRSLMLTIFRFAANEQGYVQASRF